MKAAKICRSSAYTKIGDTTEFVKKIPSADVKDAAVTKQQQKVFSNDGRLTERFICIHQQEAVANRLTFRKYVTQRANARIRDILQLNIEDES